MITIPRKFMIGNDRLHALPLSVLALALGTVAAAQTSPAAPNDDTVILNPFTVNVEKAGRYQPVEATSGGRIAVNLLDASQSVSVISREMIDDVGGIRLLDALQHVAGITESTIPGAQDRVTIRGFQTDGQTVDGFKSYSQANLDSVFVERLEAVMGPNAILAPAGVPGGTINAVTRSPDFRGNFGSVMLEAGLFDAQRGEFDFNRVVGENRRFALRVVGAYQNTEGFASDPKETYAIMPMVSYRAPTGTEVSLKFRYNKADIQNYFGLPADPSSGSDNDARTLAIVPNDLNTYDSDYRHEERPELLGLLTAPISDQLSMRLAARYSDFDTEGLQNIPSLPSSQIGGRVNPLTGRFTPGVMYGPAPTFTPSPAPAMPTTLSRGGTLQTDSWNYLNLQNDYVYTLKSKHISLTTLVGGAFNRSANKKQIHQVAKQSINYASLAPSSGDYTVGAVTNYQNSTNYDLQLFANQSIGFFDDRVTLGAGYSANYYDLSTQDRRTHLDYNATIHAQLRSGSLVVKPTDSTSLYYSYSENATPTGWPNSLDTAYRIQASGSKPLQTGSQNEVGARANLFNDRVFATVAYYSITQNNYGVQNPGNLASPAPIPPLPQLFSDREAKGWEFELHANLNKQLFAIATYTKFKNRDPNDVPFRGTGEQAASLILTYQFSDQSRLFHGLALTIDGNYLAARPGDAVSGVTAASTPTALIPNQPTFWIPSRTLINLGGAYDINDHWTVRLNIYNATDTDYIAASLNRFAVVPGNTINAVLRLYYKF